MLTLLRGTPDLIVPAISGDGSHFVVCHVKGLVDTMSALYE
jgi:hypothetical protein